MELSYQKLHGCQNDYIYLDFAFSGKALPPSVAWDQAARDLSSRERGIGSDGLILLLPKTLSEADLAMRMFNADGSEAEICGNGLRCVAKLASEALEGKKLVAVETKAGIRECQIIEVESQERSLVRANMGRPNFLPYKIPVLFDDVMVVDEEFIVDDTKFKITCVSMGNPHTVIEVSKLEDFDVALFGSKIAEHEAFPQGTNVEFVEIKGMEVHQRTWERGSGETKACGTGACAVGVSLIMRNRMDSPVTVCLQGGELIIEWDGLRDVMMTGEAVTMDSGKLSIEAYI